MDIYYYKYLKYKKKYLDLSNQLGGKTKKEVIQKIISFFDAKKNENEIIQRKINIGVINVHLNDIKKEIVKILDNKKYDFIYLKDTRRKIYKKTTLDIYQYNLIINKSLDSKMFKELSIEKKKCIFKNTYIDIYRILKNIEFINNFSSIDYNKQQKLLKFDDNNFYRILKLDDDKNKNINKILSLDLKYIKELLKKNDDEIKKLLNNDEEIKIFLSKIKKYFFF